MMILPTLNSPNMAETMEMKCPECTQTTRDFDGHYEILWCPHCRKAFSFPVEEDGQFIPYFTLPEKAGNIDPENKVFFEREKGKEAMSVISFSYSGIVLAIITLGWLFFSVFAFTINLELAVLFCVIAFVLVMTTIAQFHSKITLAYQPETKRIIYTKGPFRWWRSKISFQANEVERIQEGSLDYTIKEVPCPAIFFNSNRHSKLLFFTSDALKSSYLWIWLYTCIVRGTQPEERPVGKEDRMMTTA